MYPGTRTTPLLLGILISFAPLNTPDAQAAVTYRTVAKTGNPAPAAGVNAVFESVGVPVINATGQTAFTGYISGVYVEDTNDFGVWSEGSGSLNLIAREGNQAPGLSPDYSFKQFRAPLLGDNGNTAFLADLNGPDLDYANDQGIWTQSAGSLNLIIRESDPAPGTGPDVVFQQIYENFPAGTDTAPLLSTGGRVAFASNLTGPSVDGSNNFGVWSNASGALTLLARTGDHAPGTAPDTNFSSIGNRFTALSSNGTAAFRAQLTGPGITNLNREGIWSDAAGTVQPVLLAGDPAPGLEQGTVFNLFENPVINAHGQIAFGAYATKPNQAGTQGVWAFDANDQLRLVAQPGTHAPGTAPDESFETISSNIVINDAGDTAFVALLNGPNVDGTNWIGLWAEKQGDLHLIARHGDHAPGTPQGVVFGGNAPLTPTLRTPSMNAAGQVAFKAPLTGPGIDNSNNLGLWATDTSGILKLIARTGDLFDVNDDPLVQDLRTIVFLNVFTGSGGGDGLRNGFNDAGQLAFHLTFTDGTQGVFVANLGLPGDLDGDGFVGINDLNLVLGNWNQTVPTADARADANGDNFIGIADLNAVLGNWNAGTPPISFVPEPACLGPFVLVSLALLRRRQAP